MKKLMVLFPGIGYTNDKPLLYYTKKIAKQHDYEIFEVEFKDISKDDVFNNRKKMLEAFNKVSVIAEEALSTIDFENYEDIIFASKSIGTVAASVYAHRKGIKARQVYFTPLEQTFSLIEEGNGLVFTGTGDPWVLHENIVNGCREKKLNIRIFEGANHSLETGDVQTDLENMVNIIEETENYLVGSPIYDFFAEERNGGYKSLRDYKDKVLLIINSATGCGFTPQYEALEKLYREHKKEGFEILDFPCDQFGHQAPGSNDEIHSFCTARYDISFPQFAKIEVNGEGEPGLYTYLKSKQDFKGFLRNSQTSIYIEKLVKEADPDYQRNSNIKWNFTKFLVNRRGQVIDRFEPDAGTEIVAQAVEKAIGDI